MIRKNNRIYPHNGIVCIIDDDTGQYVPDIWEPIIQQTGIRMGFACVAGYISGEVTAQRTEYIPMSVDELRTLYNNGNEVYSHSWTHPPFYDDSTTTSNIAEQCWRSRNWLISNGFGRSADIIVYPGGLGIERTTKQSVIREYYKYGVDTMYVDGINPEPLNEYCIFRFNGDTATLDEIKSYIDRAIAEKKILVFMCHAYQLNLDKQTNITKLVTAINYAIEKGAEVMPLSEALHRVYGW